METSQEMPVREKERMMKAELDLGSGDFRKERAQYVYGSPSMNV